MERQHVEIHQNIKAYDTLVNLLESNPQAFAKREDIPTVAWGVEGFFRIIDNVDWQTLYYDGLAKCQNYDLLAMVNFFSMLLKNKHCSSVRGQYVMIPTESSSVFGIGYAMDDYFLDLHLRVDFDIEYEGKFAIVIITIDRRIVAAG